MRSTSRKGFLLSLDAIIAIGLILTLVLFIGGLSMTYHSPELRYQRLYYMGKDTLMLLENAQIGQLQDFSSIQYYQDIGILGDSDQDKTLLDIVGSMWSSDNATLNSYGANITADVLNSTIPLNYNYQVLFGGDTIYQRGTSDGSYLSRLSSIVSGIERGKPIDGYFARAYPTRVGKTGYEYFYFGGYVGEGNISILVDLPDYESIKDLSMEMAVGSDFELSINGIPSGTYTMQTNQSMRSNSWTVDSSHYTNLQNGTNVIGIDFHESYSYIGGGYMRIVYNISNINADIGNGYGDNASRTNYLPGISGIMNLYDSIYIPGVLKGMEIFLHYETMIPGLTTYLSFGNIVLYESNVTGEVNATITNSSVWGSLSSSGYDFSYLSGRTVPLRIGLRNISYVFGEAGAADVVLITDRTGSMESCDVGTSYPSSCDSSVPYHDYRSLVAQEADRTFVNTILGAGGRNFVGLIGYGERHGSTCSFLEITESNSTLQSRIEDYNYGGRWQDCGWTCTSCGVVGATELLQEKVALYNLSLIQDTDTGVTSVSSGASSSVNLDIGTINTSRFVKARFSMLVEGEDVTSGYQQCIFLNNNYLGRTCVSNPSSSDWHTCSYVVDKDWISSGLNTVTLTRGGSGGCYSGSIGDYNVKDVKLSVWEFQHNQSVEVTNTSSGALSINIADAYAEIWEHENDYPNPVDFSSGLNQSGDTFGLGSAVDGWDEQEDTYGYTGACDFNGASGGEMVIYSRYTNEDKSCAYGIEFNVTPEIYSYVTSGGRIDVVFNYMWDDVGWLSTWEIDDQIWVKARITSPSGACSSSCYLGSSLDGSHTGGDATDEVYARDDPDGDYSGGFRQDITSWIESEGVYYLDLGGKVLNSQQSERGYFRFDDISVQAYSASAGDPIVSMSFPGINFTKARSATLYFEAQGIDLDKASCLYVNDNHVGRIDYQEVNQSSGWQGVRFDIPMIFLQDGENSIEFSGGTDMGCNRSGENDMWTARNIELALVHAEEYYPYLRKKSMLIMSDGEANTMIGDCRNYDSVSCPEVTEWLTPAEETVQKACEAHDKYNITIYSVVFGDAGSDAEDMLREAACCDNCSNFFSSTDADELQEIYSRIAQGILNASYEAQTIAVNMDVGAISSLFRDSYISMNYSSSIDEPQYGEISMTFESPVFESMSGSDPITDPVNITKEGWFYVPSNVEVIEARVTSYSSQYWTDRLYVKNSSIPWNRVYWLEDFGMNYTVLGDPFVVDIPVELVSTGDNNSVRIGTGFSSINGTGGSPDSRVIYTGRIGGITLEGYSDVFEKANGSTVTVYYDYDGDNVSDGSTVVQIGSYPSDVFDPYNDAVDNAFMRLMDNLNVLWDSNPGGIGNGSAQDPYDGGIVSSDNPIDFQIPPDIRFDSASISGVPSMWGPVELEVRIWI